MVKNILCATLAGLLLALAGCESDSDKISRLAAEASRQSTAQSDGQALFRKYCVACHGADGKLSLNGAKDLTASALTPEERVGIVTKGKNLMTPFGEMLTPEEIRAVAEYTLTLK